MKTVAVRSAVSAGTLALLAGTACAQRVIELGSVSGWTNITGLTNTNNGAAPFTAGARDITGDPALFTGGGRVTEPGGGGVRDFTIDFGTIGNSFTLRSPAPDAVPQADVVVPFLSDFRIRFGNGAAVPPVTNISNLFLGATFSLYREATAGAADWALVPGQVQTVNRSYNGTTDGSPFDQTFHFTNVTRFANQATGNRAYQVRVSYSLFGSTTTIVPGLVGDVGTFGDLDQFTNPAMTPADRLGAAASLSAELTGYNGNSRGTVSAKYGRDLYGVDGSGKGGNRVKVGVIEPGSSYTNNDSLNGRLKIITAGVGGNFSDEHTLSVASIIAGSGTNEGNSGVAPGATIISASVNNYAAGGVGRTLKAAAAMVTEFGGAGKPGIINFSQAGGMSAPALDQFLNNNLNVTWVSASGNFGVRQDPAFNYLGDVPNPNFAYNNIAVGALDSTFEKPTDFSSTTLGNRPSKPDIVAPGEYILSAASRDTNADGMNNDYTRSFLGDDYRYAGGATTNRIAGTSFAAPHAAGAVALLHDYAVKHDADFDERSRDQRVMKAVLLAGAETGGLLRDRAGNKWRQPGKTGTGEQGSPVRIPTSLDPNLGAGKLNAAGALLIYSSGEIRKEDDSTSQNFQITAPGGADILPANSPRKGFWDLERVASSTLGMNSIPGTVDYILGSTTSIDFVAETGRFVGHVRPTFSYLRSVLTWNGVTNGAGTTSMLASNLELRLYLDNPFSNVTGFDPMNPTADILVAETVNAADNVKLLDLDASNWDYAFNLGGVVPLFFQPKFYLQVVNLSSDQSEEYGLAVAFSSIPGPASVSLLAVAGVVAARRRRR